MKHTKVFLDANIMIKAGKPPGGPTLIRLKDLINAGFITMLTTDLTCQEVAKKHAENDYNVINGVGEPHFRKIVKEVLGTELPETTKSELKSKLTKVYEKSTEAMFRDLTCKTLEIDNIKPSVVFSAYAADEGFFTREGKKNQFPDAFIFECLKAEASSKEPMIIVSNDRDFEKPVETEKHISLVKSLPELFEKLGLKVDAPDIEDFLEHHEDELFEAVTHELDCWGFVGDVPDSEIERTIVTGVKAMELISFGSIEKGGSILVVGQFSVKVDISYTHPNWEKTMHYSEHEHFPPSGKVSGETEASFNVDVSMSVAVDENGNPKDIEELLFLSNDFQHVQLYSYGFYRWWKENGHVISGRRFEEIQNGRERW